MQAPAIAALIAAAAAHFGDLRKASTLNGDPCPDTIAVELLAAQLDINPIALTVAFILQIVGRGIVIEDDTIDIAIVVQVISAKPRELSSMAIPGPPSQRFQSGLCLDCPLDSCELCSW